MQNSCGIHSAMSNPSVLTPWYCWYRCSSFLSLWSQRPFGSFIYPFNVVERSMENTLSTNGPLRDKARSILQKHFIFTFELFPLKPAYSFTFSISKGFLWSSPGYVKAWMIDQVLRFSIIPTQTLWILRRTLFSTFARLEDVTIGMTLNEICRHFQQLKFCKNNRLMHTLRHEIDESWCDFLSRL